MDNFQLEICANSALSCVEAERGGATRVELCAGIPEGGTTPSAGEIREARKLIKIPIHVIIRARAGDFCYSPSELDAMAYDIEVARSLGADGVVFGCLDTDGNYDAYANRLLMSKAKGMQVTFHRAFDMCRYPTEVLERLIDDGFHRVLTSGCAPTAPEGVDLLTDLVRQSQGRIGIMAGCGVRAANIAELARRTGITQFHTSLRSNMESPMKFRRREVSMGGTVMIDEYRLPVTDAFLVEQTVDILKKL
ncbi:copper homeostasis protein CutC [Porphyromonas pogonae]|uniref:copper homeostasis protein CutC n=1 Tax=Porphyromonas pogonae TaxID=867595 RepID=UPI002E780D25|nr:copper homeostasis protein CutC [Porphyromonas pogonae]